MDWSHVKAVDLLVVLSSFLPKGGQIKSVAVFPYEFGLKRMQEEAVHGPIGLFDDDMRKSVDAEGEDEHEDEDDDEEKDEDEYEGEGEDGNGSDNDDDEDVDEDGDDEIDYEKLRACELSRLRYYFAVVECNSDDIANYLYCCCDGVELERSSGKLDLRFIPDSMEFKHQPRDVANKLPESDTVDDGMEDLIAKKQEKLNLYRVLALSEDESDVEKDDEDENQDMEAMFNTGLEDLSKRIFERKDAQSESVWEACLRRKKEIKKRKEIPDEGKLPTIDYEDPRFSSLSASPHFALDPTDPQFKRSAAYAGQLAQKQKKSKKEDVGVMRLVT